MKGTTTDGKRIVYPPIVQNGTGIISVLLAEDEEVVWYYSHSLEGTTITGYTIVKKGE